MKRSALMSSAPAWRWSPPRCSVRCDSQQEAQALSDVAKPEAVGKMAPVKATVEIAKPEVVEKVAPVEAAVEIAKPAPAPKPVVRWSGFKRKERGHPRALRNRNFGRKETDERRKRSSPWKRSHHAWRRMLLVHGSGHGTTRRGC